MSAEASIREQAETLLEISNSILSAAIGGYWDEVDELERQRAGLFEKMLSIGDISGEDRIFLVGVMEHIRVVDSTTRKFLGSEQSGGWPGAYDAGLDALSEEDLDFLNPELYEPYPPKVKNPSATLQ
jgi:hypothetical protein